MERNKVALLLAVLALGGGVLAGCGSDGESDAPEGSGGGIASPVEAVDKAQEAADAAEQRAKDIEDQANRQMQDMP